MRKVVKPIGMLLLCSTLGMGNVYAVPSAGTAGVQSVQQEGTCTGVVVDATGMTVIGASVRVKGTTNGAITDLDGKFSLKNVANGAIIEITYIGYQPVEVKWEGKTLNITMKEDSEMLDEVVVVGYGTQKKVNVTGAVSMVDSEVFESRPVQNVTQALQGQIPGLNMATTNTGGELGSEMSISIRGAGTVGAGSSAQPLVLIDGMEGDMNALNPNDIESVSVLKDASASSIYGARGAFGVILITTKSGQAGKTRVNYTGNVRFSSPTRMPEMANSIDFANYFNKGLGWDMFTQETIQKMRQWQAGEFTDPTTPEYYGTIVGTDNRYLAYGSAFANTNWFEEMFRSNVPSQEHNVSVSGGSEKLTYMISGNFLNQNGLLRHGKDQYNRYTLSSKLSAKPAEWLTINLTNRWSREDNKMPNYLKNTGGNFYHNIARRWPSNPARTPHGWMNGMEIIELEEGGQWKNQQNTVSNQLQLIFEPIKDFHITLEGNMRRYTESRHEEILPITANDADGNPFGISWNGRAVGSSYIYEHRLTEDYYSTNILMDYSKTIKDHYFKIMGGFNAELYHQDYLYGDGQSIITPTVPELNQTQKLRDAWNSKNERAVAGFFGRINYNWKERYMFEANLRYDGSSRFIGDKRWGLFPSFSAGWNIAREEFFEPITHYIGTLKLRGSWGQLGNNNTDNWYPFFQTLSTGSQNSAWVINGQQMNTASLPGIVSDVLTWETIESWDIGLDFGLFNNRLTGSIEYYNRYTYDMVGPAPTLPAVLGTNAPRVNNADMKSYGWELDISWRDHIKDFNYGIRFNLSDNQDKILTYPNESGNLGTYRSGMMLNEIWGYTTVGIAQTQEQMDQHIANARPNFGTSWGAGDIMYADLNGDGEVTNGSNTIYDHGDLTIIGNSTPRYNFGLTLDGEWHGIDFSIFMQGVMKRDYWADQAYFWGAYGDEWQSTCFVEHLDYWSEDNPDAYYPRPIMSLDGTVAQKNHQKQTRYLQSAAYMRLKNVQVGYTFPQKWVNKAGIESLRVYVSADNLATFTSLSKIFDPEALISVNGGTGKTYPLQRTISIGVNLNF